MVNLLQTKIIVYLKNDLFVITIFDQEVSGYSLSNKNKK